MLFQSLNQLPYTHTTKLMIYTHTNKLMTYRHKTTQLLYNVDIDFNTHVKIGYT
jgi:hypothetical protein